MMRQVAFAGLLALSALSLLPSFGLPTFAKSGGGADETFTLRADVRLVLLDVSVRDRAGAFVPGLSKDDFSVFENGREQTIKVFTNRDIPVTMGVVVDSSGSMTPKSHEVLKAADLLIRESNLQDELFVLNFNDRVHHGLPEGVAFSSDRKQLHDALYRGRPAGKTALYDALISALKQLGKGSRGRRVLVLISDGKDNASEHTRQELLSRAEDSMTTIYSIGLYERGSEDQDPALLRKLASVTGGDAYFPSTLDAMDGVCERIARDVRQRYTVGYTPAEAADGGSSELRQIRLRVKGPGNARLAARTRSSYRFEQEAKPAQSGTKAAR